jgi:ABC-type cobalamin/Fe3+-siderophores transport system ATPase subunit
LHLPDLSIQGFRGIDDLSIPRLGRVTLLAGKNAVGKTTVLEAVRVFASRGEYEVLSDILTRRDEISVVEDEDGVSRSEPDWPALFHGRTLSSATHFTMRSGRRVLIVKEDRVKPKEATRIGRLVFGIEEDDHVRVLRVTFDDQQWALPMLFEHDVSGYSVLSLDRSPWRSRSPWKRRARSLLNEPLPPQLTCNSLGPGILTNADLARFWDTVAPTSDDERATRALRLVLGERVERVLVIGNGTSAHRGERQAVVKQWNSNRSVPLKSFGDGALRLYGVALALAYSNNGVLLIDEVENGIHHSLQQDYWRMVLQAALQNNVQVLATTHSWDCVRGFAAEAAANDGVEGVLIRLDRDEDSIRAIEYSEAELAIAARQNIEVR